MDTTGNKTLPPFHIGNIQSPQDVVRITAPEYDDTLSSNPQAALQYGDDDGDLVTVGSSFELGQQLEEQPSRIQRTQLAELHKSYEFVTEGQGFHVFSIDSGEQAQMTWQKLQESSKFQIPKAENGCENFDYSPIKSPKPRNKESSLSKILRNDLEDSSCEINSKDYRAHYFNTACPPLPHNSQKIPDVACGKVRKASIHENGDASAPTHTADSAKGQAAKHNSDSEREFLAANLTLEGKRQAQLAGEKFRARGLYSRPRKLSTGLADRQSYHNRWASYKSNDNPKSFYASLTSDGKRQGQNAGDRIRSKTSRMRHAIKAGSEQIGSADQSRNAATAAECPVRPRKAEETSKADLDGQKSLLEVFETELAKKPKISASQIDPPFVPFHPRSTPMIPSLTINENVPPRGNRIVPPQTAPTTIEDGIKAAVCGFEVCLRGIVDTLKATQPSRSDEDVLKESTNAFQSLAEKIVSLNETPSNTQMNSPVQEKSAKAEHDTEERKKFDSQFPVMTADPLMIPEVKEVRDQQLESNETDLLPPTAFQAANRRSKRKELRFEGDKPNFSSDFAGPFQYHQPGPIHLPQNSSQVQSSRLTHFEDAAPKTTGYVDNLRRFSSIDTFKNSHKSRWLQDSNPSKGLRSNRSLSPIAVTTRFPTIGQFENATFSTTMSPPALPSLIDLDAEEGPKASPSAYVGGKPSHSESYGQVQSNVAGLCSPKKSAQVDHGVPREVCNEQFLNCALGVSDGSVASKARLLRPFDAFEGEAAFHDQPGNGAQTRRSATVGARSHTPRRPYSDVFSGKGRVPWDSFTGQQREHEGKANPDARASSTSLPLPAPRAAPPRSLASPQPVTNAGVCRSATDAGARRERWPDHYAYQTSSTNLRSKDLRIRKCVDNLLGLGFDMERSRLRVYASVADGNLDEAIDMLTEDQKVHDSRK